jgi:DNA-binding MarR family transcriptional regulator
MTEHPHHPPFTTELDGVDPLSCQVFHAFKTAMMSERQLMLRLMADKGTHPAQAGCLRVLAANDGISQRDLAENLHVSRPTVTTMLQKMEKSGLIERRADAQDQRLTRIYMTDAGRRLHSSLGSAFRDLLEAGIGPMPDADRRELLRLLNDLEANISRALSPTAGGDEKGAGIPSC